MDKGDRLANNYFISHCTRQFTNILFILLLDMDALKQSRASFFTLPDENFTAHVPILVLIFKMKYVVDTGQS